MQSGFKCVVQPGGPLHRLVELVTPDARFLNQLRPRVPVVGGEPLPFDREHAVALHVAERAIVAEHVEAVKAPLERPPWLMPAVLAFADVGTAAATPARRCPGSTDLRSMSLVTPAARSAE